MHQEHNIPWNTYASHFEFVRENHLIHRTQPRITGIYPRELPTQAKSLTHFNRVLHKTITIFSSTERQKYPTSFPTPTSGKLFSDELRDRHPQFLNERNQSIEYWIESPTGQSPYSLGEPVYPTASDGELSDVVKVLLGENEMEPLLMLARHPKIPLARLDSVASAHIVFGFDHVLHSAINAYIGFNSWAAFSIYI